jgi:head-tail adaptor
MLASALRQRVQIQERVVVRDALGQSITWKHVQDVYARVIPLDTKTVVAYQQQGTQVSHRVVMRGSIDIELGKHRLLHGAKIYEPSATARHADGATDLVVLEE